MDSSFWNNIYDDAKDRRYATLFVTTCLFAIGLITLIIVPLTEMVANLRDVVTGYPKSSEIPVICLFLLAGVLFSAAVVLGQRRGRKTHCGQIKCSRLSRDELLKARLKLKRQMQPVKSRAVERPRKLLAPRAPDIDLKY
jgi:hypothetical protein